MNNNDVKNALISAPVKFLQRFVDSLTEDDIALLNTIDKSIGKTFDFQFGAIEFNPTVVANWLTVHGEGKVGGELPEHMQGFAGREVSKDYITDPTELSMVEVTKVFDDVSMRMRVTLTKLTNLNVYVLQVVFRTPEGFTGYSVMADGIFGCYHVNYDHDGFEESDARTVFELVQK